MIDPRQLSLLQKLASEQPAMLVRLGLSSEVRTTCFELNYAPETVLRERNKFCCALHDFPVCCGALHIPLHPSLPSCNFLPFPAPSSIVTAESAVRRLLLSSFVVQDVKARNTLEL